MKNLLVILVSLLLVVGLASEADAQNRAIVFNAVDYTGTGADTSSVLSLALAGQTTPSYIGVLFDFDDSVNVNIYVDYRRTGGTWSAAVELTTDSLTATAAKAIGYVLRGDGNVADKVPGADQIRLRIDERATQNSLLGGTVTAILWKKP